MLEGTYEEIREETLKTVEKKLDEGLDIVNIIVAVGLWIAMTGLTMYEKESITRETIEFCQSVVTQKQINVEKYSAIKELTAEFI